MKLSLYPYQLRFTNPFRITHGIRTHTDVVYIELNYEGLTGWGEVTLPPYLSDTVETTYTFLKKFAFEIGSTDIDVWIAKLDEIKTNMPAKAGLDMALWQLKSALTQKSIRQLLGVHAKETALNSYTIGLSTEKEVFDKIKESEREGFDMFKLKLNGHEDETTVNVFRKYSQKGFSVDVNQGWTSVEQAMNISTFLTRQGCLFIEQPFPVSMQKQMKELHERSPLDFFADESCQTLSDIDKVKEGFDGINIKLMKCGGLAEAGRMIVKARSLGMKVLIGCMSESSLGCHMAAILSPLADFTDLDGPYLIANDPFEGVQMWEGKLILTNLRKIKLLKR